MILGEFEVTMSKPWKMDRKQTQNHSSPGLLFSYIGDFPGLPFFHQCLMGSLFCIYVFLIFQSAEMAASGRALLASLPLSSLLNVYVPRFFFSWGGRKETPRYECIKGKYEKSLEIRSFRDCVDSISGFSLYTHSLEKVPAPEGLCQLKFKNDISEINLNFAWPGI